MTTNDSRADSKVSLGEAAYAHVRRGIITCRFAPGDRLTERQLAADTGFGLSPLRAALTRLDFEGLVVTVPRKGYRVTTLTPKSITNLFDLWSFVGPEIFRLGLHRCSDEELESILAAHTRMAGRPGDQGPPDPLDQDEASRSFTMQMAKATGNEYFVQIVERLSGDMSRVWLTVLLNDPDIASVVERVNFRREDIAGRNGDAVAAAARETIEEFQVRVQALIAAWPSIASAEISPL